MKPDFKALVAIGWMLGTGGLFVWGFVVPKLWPGHGGVW